MNNETENYEKIGETGMTDYQTKILMAAIADMLDSSADINEARIRFASITGEFSSVKNSVVMHTDNAEDAVVLKNAPTNEGQE